MRTEPTSPTASPATSHAASLATLQREMLSSILASKPMAAVAPLQAEINSGALTASKRLSIYQHNTKSTLSHALASLYPVIHRIVGVAFFDELAAQYIAATPSRSGDLHDYGSNFADFVSRYVPAESLPYLADVARLEWRWHLAFHAADSAPFDVARLENIAPEDLGALQFVVSPAASLITSTYPLLQIWLFNMPNDAHDASADSPASSNDVVIDWDIDNAYFVISRPSVSVEIREITSAAFSFLAALRARSSLANALDAAYRRDSQFNLQQVLSHFIDWHILIDIKFPQH